MQRLPVDSNRLRRAANSSWRSYVRNLTADTTTVFGIAWGSIPGRHPSDQQIVNPPFANLVDDYEPQLCPGPTDHPSERIMANTDWRNLIEEMKRGTPAAGEDVRLPR
jgi:hypothetical protein